MAGRSTHMGIPVTTERSTRSRDAPRWNSSKGRMTTACPASRTPRIRLDEACCRPSLAPPGCRKSAAPRSTGVQACAIAPSSPLSADPALARAAGAPARADPAAGAAAAAASCPSERQVSTYSRTDWVPTKIRSVRSMLSTVTCFRKETVPRRTVREMCWLPPPVWYCFKDSRTTSASPPPMFAKDLIGVTPISDRRICVLFRSELQDCTTCSITSSAPTAPRT
mmetsp:Transcript_8817/g.23980  ORF Transcript_8817/g.23980 Transcript_8817/m.23980 type:complete len:224 (+) Transcript_8817:328-999(+)